MTNGQVRITDGQLVGSCLGSEPSLNDFAMHFRCALENLHCARESYTNDPSRNRFDVVLLCARCVMDALAEVLKDWDCPSDSEWKEQWRQCQDVLAQFKSDDERGSCFRDVCDRAVHGPPREKWQKGETGYVAWDKYLLMRWRADAKATDDWLKSLYELIDPLEHVNFLEPPPSEARDG